MPTDDYDNLSLLPVVSVDHQGRLLQPTVSGAILRESAVASETTRQPTIDTLIASAATGVAADPLSPSANPGQWIRVSGQNLDVEQLKIEFPVSVSPISTLADDVTTRSAYRFSSDSTTAWVRVPWNAATGEVRMIGGDTSYFFQVVPLPPSESLDGIHYHPDEVEIRIDGVKVLSCNRADASLDCADVELWARRPTPYESVELSTVGGTATTYVSRERISHADNYRIAAVDHIQNRFTESSNYGSSAELLGELRQFFEDC